MATQVKLTVPTLNDFKSGEEVARVLYNELETVNYALDRVINHAHGSDTWPDDVEIDSAYIGELYDFVETMTIETGELVKFAERMRQQLRDLNGYRVEFEGRAVKEGDKG